jgi:hypothetical protein
MRPEKGTYPEYFTHYLPLVREDNVMEALQTNLQILTGFISDIPKNKEDFIYAPGKWSVKQVISHVCDTERILAYRALRFARLDPAQPLPFDENRYAASVDLGERGCSDLLNEFESIRQSSISLFGSFNDDTLLRAGKTAAGETTVLALGYLICGHAAHHMNVLKERYLAAKS